MPAMLDRMHMQLRHKLLWYDVVKSIYVHNVFANAFCFLQVMSILA